MKPPTVGVIFRRLGPYHHVRLRAAATRLDVLAVELSGCDKVYAWGKVEGASGFRRVDLFPDDDLDQVPYRTLYRRMGEVLSVAEPSAVAIPGWADKGALAALQWCQERGVPAILMSESCAHDERRSVWKEWVKRRVVHLCASGLVGGRLHADYLASLWMPRERIFLGYDAVDNDHFARGAEAVRRGDSPAVERCDGGAGGQGESTTVGRCDGGAGGQGDRGTVGRCDGGAGGQGESTTVGRCDSEAVGQRDGGTDVPTYRRTDVPSNRFFLASARFVPKKNLVRLVEAYARYRALASDPHTSTGDRPWDLVILGGGPLESQVRRRISQLGLESVVHLPGFKQYDELPAFYGRASAFVHPSTTEQWGLVVNEAMAAGLPVLVSNRCGCAADLVQEGVNGFTFDPYDIDGLARLMATVSAPGADLAALGDGSRRIIGDWGVERFADGLAGAVEAALRRPIPKPTLVDRLLLRVLLHR